VLRRSRRYTILTSKYNIQTDLPPPVSRLFAAMFTALERKFPVEKGELSKEEIDDFSGLRKTN
jgi:hypothetical protein